MKETDAQKKIVISDEEDLETLDRKFGTDKWWRKDFPFNDENDGKNKIVLNLSDFHKSAVLLKFLSNAHLWSLLKKGLEW